MRKSAAEVIRSLETRVARLERTAGVIPLPPGFEGFGFNLSKIEPTPRDKAKREYEIKFNRGRPSRLLAPEEYMEKSDFLSGPISLSNHPFIAFIYADTDSSRAEMIGRKYFRSLKGKRKYTASMPYLHDFPVVVGTEDGEITLVNPPKKVKRERAVNPRDEAVKKAEERSFNENLGLQISASRKRDEVKVYSPRTHNPTGKVIKLVIHYEKLDQVLDAVSNYRT